MIIIESNISRHRTKMNKNIYFGIVVIDAFVIKYYLKFWGRK